MVASSILAGGACKNKDLDEPLVPPVIKNGLVPRNGGESAAGQGDLGQEVMAEAAARPRATERVEPPAVVEERTERAASPSRAPAHRVQLARALADAVVGAIEAGDVEGARVAVGMLGEFVGVMVDRK